MTGTTWAFAAPMAIGCMDGAECRHRHPRNVPCLVGSQEWRLGLTGLMPEYSPERQRPSQDV